MSRPTRAGTAGKPVTIRATVDEIELWQAAADASQSSSLSDFIRPAITSLAVGVIELKLKPGAKKSRLLAASKVLNGGKR